MNVPHLFHVFFLCLFFLFQVRKAVIVTFVTAFLYNIPRYFEFEVYLNANTRTYFIDKTPLAMNVVYRYLYNLILYALCLFFTTRQETVGDVTVPSAEGTKPNGDSAQHRPRLLRLWDAIFSREHDRLNGPVLFREVVFYYLHGGGELACRTQLRV